MTEQYNLLFTITLIILGVLMFPALLRTVIGPRIADRILGINLTGPIVIMMIAVLAVMKSEGYLIDVAIIYAMLSFLAVVVLTRIYIGVFRARKETEEKKNG